MRISIVFVLCTLLSACGGGIFAAKSDLHSQEATAQAKSASAEQGKAVVYILRRDTLAGAAWYTVVGVNGRVIGRLWPDTFFRLLLEPGDYQLTGFHAMPFDSRLPNGIASVSSRAPQNTPFTFRAGETYHIDQRTFDIGWATPGYVGFELLSANEGIRLLASSRLAKFYPDTDLLEYRKTIIQTRDNYVQRQKLERERKKEETRIKAEEEAAIRAAEPPLFTSEDVASAVGAILGIVLFGVLIAAGAHATQPNYAPPRPMPIMDLQRTMEAPRPSVAPVFRPTSPQPVPTRNYDLSASKYPGSPITLTTPTQPSSLESKTYYSNAGTDWRVDGNTITSTKGDRYRVEGNMIYSQTGKRYRIDGSNIIGDDGTRCRVIANQVLCD